MINVCELRFAASTVTSSEDIKKAKQRMEGLERVLVLAKRVLPNTRSQLSVALCLERDVLLCD